MAETVVECYHSSEGNLLAELADHMGKSWKEVKLSDADILELEKYLAIMMPMKQLFSSLNSDTESNITRVYPTVLNLLGVLEEYVQDEECSAYDMAQELKSELSSTFGYVIDPESEDFNPIYVAATFLDPLFHAVVAQDEVLRGEAVTFLSKLVASGSVEPDGDQSTSAIKIKGFPFLKQTVSIKSGDASGSPCDRDITKYLDRASSFLIRTTNEAYANAAEDGNGNQGSNQLLITIYFFYIIFVLFMFSCARGQTGGYTDVLVSRGTERRICDNSTSCCSRFDGSTEYQHLL